MVDVTLRFAVFLTFAAFSIASKQGVPLFMWSNDRLDVPAPISGHTTTAEEFNEGYLGSLLGSKQNVIAFVQDRLSVDDVTQHADVYNENSDGAALHNLKELLEQHNSAQLPSVRNVPDILDKLRKEFPGKVHELSEPYDIGDLPLDESSNLIIAQLPSAGNSHAEVDSNLNKNDEVIKSVNDDLKSLGKPFTALFTAEKPSTTPAQSVYTGRHLLETTDAAPANFSFFNISGFLYFYATTLELDLAQYPGGKENAPVTKFILPFGKADTSGSSAGNNTATLKLTYKDIKANESKPELGTMDNVELTFLFGVGGTPVWSGFWRIVEFNITYSGGNASKWSGDNVPLKGYDIYAPFTGSYQFSYHCTDTAPYSQRVDKSKEVTQQSIVRMRFKGLQVQFSTKDMPIRGDSFGRPNDCDGFFTIPILSGLFAGLILILILVYGIAMISSITTMDRFDDPKGKSITVNVNE